MVWIGPTEPLAGEWQVDIHQVGRWRYDLTLRRDWLALTPERIWGRRRAVRRAHEMVGNQRCPEPVAIVGGGA